MSFQDDLSFLPRHTATFVLEDGDSDACAVVCPDLQGRVMTSRPGGADRPGFGWINRECVASPSPHPRFNLYGGEDRFCLGPEFGPFSLFFPPGAPVADASFIIPASLDREPFEVVHRSTAGVSLRKRMSLTNRRGTSFEREVERRIRMLPLSGPLGDLGVEGISGIRGVAFESGNHVTNLGERTWGEETGLLSIWILGMFPASPASVVVLPFRPGPERDLGPVLREGYFGAIPAERPAQGERALFFRGDGIHRGKVGLTPRRSPSVMGSYDAARSVLTLVKFSPPPGPGPYVNSRPEPQADPYGGDAVNPYNAGSPGAAFYELESSSAALALSPGESAEHRVATLHWVGSEEGLDRVSRGVLGIGLGEIRASFGRPS